MKIEAGKYYRLRNGRKAYVHLILEGDLKNAIGYYYGNNGYFPSFWNSDGSYDCNKEFSDLDVVEEWREVVTIEFDRSMLPPWCNKAIAMDNFGDWFAYSSLPYISGSSWFSNMYLVIPNEYPPKFSGDWKDSLFVFDEETMKWVNKKHDELKTKEE